MVHTELQLAKLYSAVASAAIKDNRKLYCVYMM